MFMHWTVYLYMGAGHGPARRSIDRGELPVQWMVVQRMVVGRRIDATRLRRVAPTFCPPEGGGIQKKGWQNFWPPFDPAIRSGGMQLAVRWHANGE